MRGEKKEDWRGEKKRRVGGLAAACLDGKDTSTTSFAVKNKEHPYFFITEANLGRYLIRERTRYLSPIVPGT